MQLFQPTVTYDPQAALAISAMWQKLPVPYRVPMLGAFLSSRFGKVADLPVITIISVQVDLPERQ